ncbi:MAG: hypothetical protein HC822_00695 [Oscillochloris sp.]|nr:hypothetical protein [Oscillochloris sp.]
MHLQHYVDILLRRRWIIVFTVIAAIAVAAAGAWLLTPNYSATATMRVSPRSADLDYGLLEYAVRLKNTYAEIAESGPAIQALQQRFGIERSAAELRRYLQQSDDPCLCGARGAGRNIHGNPEYTGARSFHHRRR